MIDTDALNGRTELLVIGGIAAVGVFVLISQSRKQSAMLAELRQIKLLNHPYFDVETGEFDPPESVRENIEQEADAETE